MGPERGGGSEWANQLGSGAGMGLGAHLVLTRWVVNNHLKIGPNAIESCHHEYQLHHASGRKCAEDDAVWPVRVRRKVAMVRAWLKVRGGARYCVHRCKRPEVGIWGPAWCTPPRSEGTQEAPLVRAADAEQYSIERPHSFVGPGVRTGGAFGACNGANTGDLASTDR